MVFAVKVNAEGSESVGVVVPVTVISFAVPVMLVTAAVPLLAAVTSPLAFTVRLAFVKLPTLLFTVASVVARLLLVTSPVRSPMLVTSPAVRPAAVPVIFVPSSADGVPRSPLTSASVPVASGNVMTRPAVETASIKVTALAALDELRKRMPLLKSVPSLIVKSPLPFGCKCTPIFALAPSART